MAKILVTGATGFIGKRLIIRLLKENHEIYALSRIKGIDLKFPDLSQFHVLHGDIRDPEKVDPIPQDIEAVYYLVHSLGSLVQNLIDEEVTVARNFLSIIEKTSCKQIIFLGGIIENEEHLSPHLFSRLAVEKVIRSSKIPHTILRASIIIGSGSASFEIVRDLVEKLPVMIAPRWVRSYCQPIAIRDVLFYLSAVLLNRSCFNKTLDIGGPEPMTFKEVLQRYAAFRKMRRFIFDVPFLTPKLSSYWLVFITSVRFSICTYLVESMKYNTRKLNKEIDKIIPHQCLLFEGALKLAFQKIQQNEVISSWMDAWDLKKLNPDIEQFLEVPQEGCFKETNSFPIRSSIERVKRNIWSLGGARGWPALNWAWRIRGLVDQLVGGTGINRGRRDPENIEVGDSIDFWRVLLADREKGHLVLFAEMKVPGEAWLEFKINESQKLLEQTATFRPKGFWGRFYWYFLWPFHHLIFKRMVKKLASAS